MADASSAQSSGPLKCLVAGWDAICGLPLGHEGFHHQDKGPGCVSWGTPTPRWDAPLGRWVKPDEPEYEEGLQRLREAVRR